MDPHGFAGFCGFSLEISHDVSPDPRAAIPCQQRDVHDVGFILAAIEIEAPDGYTALQDNLESGVTELSLTVNVLGVELHAQKYFLVCIIPGYRCHFLLTRARIGTVEELHVVVADGAKMDERIHGPYIDGSKRVRSTQKIIMTGGACICFIILIFPSRVAGAGISPRKGIGTMKISRLEFLRACAATGILENPRAFTWANRPIMAAGRKGMNKIMLETVTAADFAGHLDTKFRVSPVEGPSLDLVLTEVDEAPEQSGLEQFTPIFRGTRK
jgi:hypothetical protein